MFKQWFARQARKPTGWLGRLVFTRIFDKGNKPLNDRMRDLVIGHGGAAILEIGFGCGDVIRDVADSLDGAMVEGIDFSDAMLDVARSRNKHHIRNGRVQLTHGNFDATRYEADAFDSVCSANTIYFWPDPTATCERIHSALKPGGIVVLAFVDKSKMDTMSLDPEVFTAISVDSVQRLLTEVGFSEVDAHSLDEAGAMYCVTARN